MSNTYHYHHPLPITQTHHTSKRGFTIVELLIVIVVIAILAAFSVVSYNGIQQRASNAAMISAAGQTKKLLDLYVAANGALPAATMCATVDNRCSTWSANGPYTRDNTGFISMLRTVGEPLQSAPASGHINQANYGIRYDYNGTSGSLYWSLQGGDQQCGVSGSTSSNFEADQGTRTLCRIRLS